MGKEENSQYADLTVWAMVTDEDAQDDTAVELFKASPEPVKDESITAKRCSVCGHGQNGCFTAQQLFVYLTTKGQLDVEHARHLVSSFTRLDKK